VLHHVSSEVLNATETANALYHRWQELMSETASVSKEEFNWTANELRNCLRSIEWDLEDLEETIYILYWFTDHISLRQHGLPDDVTRSLPGDCH